MRILRLDHVYYWTADMEAAVAFYRDVVGLPLLARSGDSWAEFDAGPVRFALHGAVGGRPVSPGGATIVFEVGDLDVARRTLEERGAQLDEHEGEIPDQARYASFLDPDGNTVQIIEYLRR